eukprot:MONOS_4040.1-p1 / transcript=MONOS_4040.1 / gene=MONOS_4040 / organism=Monocercomonoides_exilis_PA203 / gene_product=unspecified product / transcript_product=unspecified product / location=Mono_scaffold00102:85979-93604(+) / protein_length=2541 / sequence_SO=supercontig / SO=protein_coding / is_pseudo=false
MFSSNGNSLLNLHNSSVELHEIALLENIEKCTLYCDSSSMVNITGCQLSITSLSIQPFIESSGIVLLTSVTIDFRFCARKTRNQPLIHVYECEYVSLKNASLKSLEISTSDGTALYSGEASKIEIDNCMFFNISHTKHSQSFNCSRSSSKWLEISSSFFESCFQPYYGTIVSPSSLSFTATNCSFSSCQSSSSFSNDSFTERQIFKSGNISFVDCFFKCASPYAPGGALSFEETNASSLVLRCHFHECCCGSTDVNVNGGSIHSYSSICLEVLNSNFTSSNSSYCCGGVTSFNDSFCLIKNCYFSKCHSVHYSAILIEFTNGSIVDSSIVSECIASNNAGLCFFSANGKGFVTDCCFKKCVSSSYGTMLYNMDFGKYHGGYIKYCYFVDNKNPNNNGNDITLNHAWVGKLADSDVNECYSTSAKPRVLDGSEIKDNWVPDPLQTTDNLQELFVEQRRGEDESGCGYRSRPFKTIEYALIQRSTQKITVFDGSYEMTGSLVISFEMEFVGHRLDNSVIRSCNEDAGASLITVENGNLFISAFLLIHDSTTSSSVRFLSINENGMINLENCELRSEENEQTQQFTQPVIDLHGGMMNVVCCSFTHLSMNGKPVVSMISTKCTNFTQSSFTGIERRSGNGSLIEAILGTGEKLSFTECNVTHCTCQDGNGGALMVKMNDESKLEIGQDLVNGIETTFQQCSAGKGLSERGVGGGVMIDCTGGGKMFQFSQTTFSGNQAEYGKSVFVVGSDFAELCVETKFAIQTNDSVLDELMGFDENEIGAAIPLVLLWKPFPSVVSVSGSTGTDHIMCGFAVSPCSTLQYAISTHFDSSTRKICIVPPFQFEEAAVLEGFDFEFSASTRGTTIKIVGDSSSPVNGYLETRINTTFTNITFSLPSSLPLCKPLLCCTENMLTILMCGAVPSSTDDVLSYCFCCALGGMLNVSQFEIVGVSFGENPFISISGDGTKGLLDFLNMSQISSGSNEGLISVSKKGSLTIKNVNFSSFEDNDCSVVFCKNGKSINMIDSNFSSVTRTTNSGTCLCITRENGAIITVAVNNCSFNECKVESEPNGGGGGVYGKIGNDCTLKLTGCSFVLCSAPWSQHGEANNGKGGGIFLDVEGNDSAFTITDPSFRDNKAEFGKNVFLTCQDLNSTVTNKSFAFEYEQMASDGSLFVGDDQTFLHTDLFRFLVKYESTMIFVSNNGHDVMRCGSMDDPCKTFWKGLEQISSNASEPKIGIVAACTVTDMCLFSDIAVESSSAEDDEPAKSVMTFENDVPTKNIMLEVKNDVSFNFIQFSTTANFSCLNQALITCRDGFLAIASCSLNSLAPRTSPLRAMFVNILHGCLLIRDFDVNSINIGRSMIEVSNKVDVSINNTRLQSINVTDGSLINMIPSVAEWGNENDKQICINNSVFYSVDGRSDGGRTLSCIDSTGSEVDLIKCTFSGCQAMENRKGGCVFFELCEDGLFNLKECIVQMCGCSTINGRGGGIYLRTELQAKLQILIEPLKFESNAASVGRDMFIECNNLNTQVNETMFKMNFDSSVFVHLNAIFGIDKAEHSLTPMDLLEIILIYQADTILVSSQPENGGRDTQQCGTLLLPCQTIGYSLIHLTHKLESRLIVDKQSVIDCEITLSEMAMLSRNKNNSAIHISPSISKNKSCTIECSGTVALKQLSFCFPSTMVTDHSTFLFLDHGILSVESCCFTANDGSSIAHISFVLLELEYSEIDMQNLLIEHISSSCAWLVQIHSSGGDVYLEKLRVCSVQTDMGIINVEGISNGESSTSNSSLTLLHMQIENVTIPPEESTLLNINNYRCRVYCANDSFFHKGTSQKKGSAIVISSCIDVSVDTAVIEGSENDISINEAIDEGKAICRWNGSMIELKNSSTTMRGMLIANCSNGAMSMCGGEMTIEMGMFADNNPQHIKFPSARRNIICSDGASLEITSLKGGDGWRDNSSLWILDDGCEMAGIADMRPSTLFIPSLRNVKSEEKDTLITLAFEGSLLLPCNLSFVVSTRVGDEEMLETHIFEESKFESENMVFGVISADLIRNARDDMEVSVKIQYGKIDAPKSTQSFVLKNRSEIQPKGDEKLVEGGNKEKSYWMLIVIVIFAVLFLIVLVVAIAFIIRWKKAKNENKDLREIVNDNIRKDPKAFEMVTMEMSPEEQWRRAEREAEKKNEERIKKRMNGKEMQHSESEEYLLSENGSTEYILGRDSDKIPQWMLEKIDEKKIEDETRKRTPSPSISSTSTTDTSDSDSTFVRGEDLCPTTSSMSNLVDAMACSSPHEKLIVDLRDSLFMLLHGSNKTKEMTIGTLQEREQTAAQIMFWVANLALHSFDEMENPLSSLANLSPHIVLFSEHMVICIVMHSDLSSDSDSSSISSSTIITSSSDDSTINKNGRGSPPPSSAFEDEDDFKKECLRWKAPELLNGAKTHATKKTVAFSIGMMLWESLTLQIPFGEYEAVIAGDKIVRGERPDTSKTIETSYCEVIKECLSVDRKERPTLVGLKREFIGHFPAGTVMLTVSDAIDYEAVSFVEDQRLSTGQMMSSEQ